MKRSPKVLSYIKILNKNELACLRDRLVRDKKLRLLVLLDYLKTLGEKAFLEKERNDLFYKLFNAHFTDKKDYLLRNEFRLLTEQIEEVLVEEEMKREAEQNKNIFNFYLLHALQRHNALDLFQKEYLEAYTSALENSDAYLAYNMAGLHFENHTTLHNLKEKDLPYVEKLNDLQLSHISAVYLAAYRTHQINSAYTRTFSYPFSIHERPLAKDVEANFNTAENRYPDYLFLKAKSFVVPHPDRVALLEKCLTYVNDRLKEGVLYEEELKFCLLALANTHSLLMHYEQATAYFEDFFNIEMPADDPQRLSALTDYIVKLIKLNKLQQAITLIEENEQLIKDIPKLETRIRCLKIACYALTGNTAKLFVALPQNLSDYSLQLKKFLRFYFAIHAYQEGRIEEAHRETQNMYNTYRQAKLTYNVLPILKFFQRFFYLQLQFLPSDKKKEKHLLLLMEDMKHYANETLPEYRSYLPFLWLKKETGTKGS